MLKSTEEYLALLRQGELLSALEWVSFLEQSYGGKNEQISADQLLPVAIYDLINHGFSKADDLCAIVVLYALINEQPSMLPGTLDYAATILVSAAMQCLVYEDLQILSEYKQQPLTHNLKTIEQLVSQETERFTASINRDHLLKKGNELGLLAKSNPYCKTIEITRQRLLQLELCEAYAEELKNQTDKAFALRAGVVQALLDQFKKKMGSDECDNLLKDYVNKLREMGPEIWEENLYLSKLAPKNVLEEFLDNTKTSLHFFIGSWISRLISNAEVELPKETKTDKEQSPQL
ncbi:hypothetical protein DIZ81_12235 [Legionella taurinensis]|uniref:Uncharacterized protein n=1 Tax=Legionella taurinensis TaxID=70611 RepID=A0A3A5L262_9GAMM|nr:helical bundle domain-containing protein [Legionella taurinensis]MDX1838510.1 helical bundle domain-containing protein [Legionella taurinensis]PUT38952.1 hypothetical protein DB744_12245 [Legionella taurinensis]PUT41013.1 hypothetical protein DB746_10640 [Legionella taurinensis]PUT43245.1 hypothetical protein DB743_11640 [Legionella taurinensis]PUT46431.1 hypothetical protein DB745_11125 [Legionella taurinensis]